MIIVLLDFPKAFDLIDQYKFLIKLEANDVPHQIWVGRFSLIGYSK